MELSRRVLSAARPGLACVLHVKADMSKTTCQGGLAGSEKNISVSASMLPKAAQEHTGSLQNVNARSGGTFDIWWRCEISIRGTIGEECGIRKAARHIT